MKTTWPFVRNWRNLSVFAGVSLVVFGMLLLPIGAKDQGSSTGALTGTVRDSSGAVVPGAQVIVTKMDEHGYPTDFSRTTVSADDGSFAYQLLPLGPGAYRLQVEKKGFYAYQQLVISHAAQVSVKLEPQPEEDANALTVDRHQFGDDIKLPPYIRRLTYFGARPDWSLDGKHLIFLEKTFGDVFEVDLATGVILPVTHHYFNAGYTRVLYLANGDILLSGAREFSPQNPFVSRRDTSELWVLDKNLDKPPTPLGERCYEGPAVSRTKMRIAWTVQHSNYPERIPEGVYQIWMADIQYVNGIPAIANKQKILDTGTQPFKKVETRSFRPPLEKELTFTASIGDSNVMGLDLETGKIVNYTNTSDHNEPKGIFPDGQYTTIDSNRAHPGLFAMDIWKLKLDSSNQAERLTYFSEGGRFNATNSAVSDDGKYMAFQLAINGEQMGDGHGIFVYDFAAARKYFAENNNPAH